MHVCMCSTFLHAYDVCVHAFLHVGICFCIHACIYVLYVCCMYLSKYACCFVCRYVYVYMHACINGLCRIIYIHTCKLPHV